MTNSSYCRRQDSFARAASPHAPPHLIERSLPAPAQAGGAVGTLRPPEKTPPRSGNSIDETLAPGADLSTFSVRGDETIFSTTTTTTCTMTSTTGCLSLRRGGDPTCRSCRQRSARSVRNRSGFREEETREVWYEGSWGCGSFCGVCRAVLAIRDSSLRPERSTNVCSVAAVLGCHERRRSCVPSAWFVELTTWL